MYSELRKKVMQSMISSSDCVDEMSWGRLYMMNPKLPLITSKKYSGRFLKTSGCSEDRGRVNCCLGNWRWEETCRSSQIVTKRMNCMDRVWASSSSSTPVTACLYDRPLSCSVLYFLSAFSNM